MTGHRQCARGASPTNKIGERAEKLKDAQFGRQRYDARSGIQFETDIIPATVTCTDIAAEL